MCNLSIREKSTENFVECLGVICGKLGFPNALTVEKWRARAGFFYFQLGTQKKKNRELGNCRPLNHLDFGGINFNYLASAHVRDTFAHIHGALTYIYMCLAKMRLPNQWLGSHMHISRGTFDYMSKERWVIYNCPKEYILYVNYLKNVVTFQINERTMKEIRD